MRNVFLSFDSDDLQLVNLFRAQAKSERSDLEFADCSVKEPFDSHRAEYIRSQIRPMIRRASVTVCLIGYRTYLSPWVAWEIGEAAEQGKGIVGVRLHSDQIFDMSPSLLFRMNAGVVNWHTSSVVHEIDMAALLAERRNEYPAF